MSVKHFSVSFYERTCPSLTKKDDHGVTSTQKILKIQETLDPKLAKSISNIAISAWDPQE